jgi:hypothetical protein
MKTRKVIPSKSRKSQIATDPTSDEIQILPIKVSDKKASAKPNRRAGASRRKCLWAADPVPRGCRLNREEAANSIGFLPETFDKLVRTGWLPRPKRIDGRKVWNARKLWDMADEIPDEAVPDLSRNEAARFIKIKKRWFDTLVRWGWLPGPKRIDGRKVWNARQLMIVFEELPKDELLFWLYDPREFDKASRAAVGDVCSSS